MRKALVIGINHYESVGSLYGCVNDAYEVKSVLERNGDGTINFGVRLLTASNHEESIGRDELRESIAELFSGDSEIALLYFSGHGHIESTGGYILHSDTKTGNDGVPLSEIITMAIDATKIKNKVIILDSCHSGVAGKMSHGSLTELSEGMTILTASTAEQYATERNGSGIFTALFVDALMGGASNLLGNITPGSVYAHIDQSLGPWQQRPVFKTNVKSFISLRTIPPLVSLADIQSIISLFPEAGYEFILDPSYEPKRSESDIDVVDPNPENNAKFAILQRFNRVGLVVPIGTIHMYYAAMESRSCRLTALGEHYRRLVENELI